ncbi:hypothetical protein, partial [Bradyrhizobium sp.]|uniref:hypothetical protein n=1 Tax=Bradyrhizobium sp. TaxID=376 RepID=UPI003C72BFCC
MDTYGGQSTTADQIDALINGGGGSFPNSISPPQFESMTEPRRIILRLDDLMDFGHGKTRVLVPLGGIEHQLDLTAELGPE